MVDVKSSTSPLFLRDEELRQGIELLFYAYRDFTSDPDKILAEYGFGRAHHRVIHFVGRYPGNSMAELLGILRITKQSLSRVLGQLLARGFIVQHTDSRDRRRRRLRLTETGVELERRLSAPQRARVARAYREAGAGAVDAHRKVLLALLNEEDREHILRRIAES